MPYLARVDASIVLDPGDDVSVAGNVESLGLCLCRGGFGSVQDIGKVLHLLGCDLERPSALALPIRSVDRGCVCHGVIVSSYHLRLEWRGRKYRESTRSSPAAVAGGADDGGLVNVAGANEALSMSVIARVVDRGSWYRTWCQHKLRQN